MSFTFIDVLPLLILFAVLSGLVLALNYVRQSSTNSSRNGSTTPATAGEEQLSNGNTLTRRRRGGVARMQRAVTLAEERGGDGTEVRGSSSSNTERRQLRKEQKRAARREAQEAREARLEEYRVLEERKAEEQREEEELELEKEQELRKEQEVKERQEKEEYEQWKSSISIEESGNDEELNDMTKEQNSSLFNEFIKYIKSNKIVVLEELANEFHLDTQQIINRINVLQKNNQLSGFFDDRGKFIYVDLDQMKQISKFIMEKGKISINELSIHCTKVLELDQLTNANNNVEYIDEIDDDVEDAN